MSLQIRRIESTDDFAALAPLWAEVAAASGQSSPFLSHDWFSCCWHAVGPERRPEVLLIEDTSGPVAIIPMMHWRQRVRGLPIRCLALLECPDTQLLDLLVLGDPGRAIEVFLDHLATRSDLDTVLLQKLPAASATAKALEEALPGRLSWRRNAPFSSPYLEITGTWEAFFRSKTQRFRKTCRNIENRIQRAGEVTVQEHRVVDPDGPILAEVMEVSRQSWKAPKGVAMATMQGMPRFFRDLTRQASANGWLHLWILRLDGRAVATEYQIGSSGRIYALRADFDPALTDLSPGAYLNARIIQSLFERPDVHEYDMGPGTNEYKMRWASGIRESLNLEIYAPTIYGRMLHTIETRIVPFGRRLRDRLVSVSKQSALSLRDCVRTFESSNGP